MKKGLLIYQRIIIIQFISVLIIMSLFGIYLYNSNQNKEIRKLTDQTDSLMERLSFNLSIPLWNLDLNSCHKLLIQEIKDKYIMAIVINQDSKLFMGRIQTGEKDITENINNIDEYKNTLETAYAVKKEKIAYEDTEGKKEIGELILYITDSPVKEALSDLLTQTILQALILVIILSILIFIILNLFLDKPLKQITQTASRIARGEAGLQAYAGGPREIATLANAFNAMTGQLGKKADVFEKINNILTEIINKAKEIIVNLNSSSKEIEAAAQEQTSGATEQASGITEVSATLEELSITAKQITKNVGDLVISSEEVTKLLEESEKKLLDTVNQLEDVGRISEKNAAEVGELGERSKLINDMVKLIKNVANKTDMLSINASIEASKDKKAGRGFRVIATEIRELSKKTIDSAKEVEKTAKEIQDFLNSIIISSENEAGKVIESGKVVKTIYENIEAIVSRINDNFSFTQKIDVSIKQQETGSRQAADTMKQMSEIARQAAETARQTSTAVNDIVNLSNDLEEVIQKVNENDIETYENKIVNEDEKNVVLNETPSASFAEQEPAFQEQDYADNGDSMVQGVFDNLNTFISKQVPKVIQFPIKYYDKIRSKLGKSDNQ